MSGVSGEINDNPDNIKPGNSINFPSPLVNTYGTIQRVTDSPSQFILPPGSIFEITFQVGIQNTGALVLVLNGVEQLFTVVGKSGGGFVIGTTIISTPSDGASIISINNPSTNNPLSSVTGGLKVDSSTGALTQPLSCHLIIKQLA
jgi:hypothetical protein